MTQLIRTKTRTRPQRQRGAALVTALVLLLILTILGITGIVTATLELQMAGNLQYQERAFEAAEHAIEQAMVSPDLSTGNTIASPGSPACGDACKTPTTVDAYDYEVYYDSSSGGTPVVGGGYTIGAGMEAYHFIVEAHGEAARGARSDHTQSFYILGPSDN
jgi:Tfp pilus assembly protein PilX